MSGTKTCTKCNVEKKVNEFGNNKSSKDGLSHSCKDCCNKKSKEWYKNNKEYASKRNKLYNKKNHTKILKYTKQYRDKNKEKIKKANNKYYIKNKKEIAIKSKKYWSNPANKLKNNERSLNYYHNTIKNNDILYLKSILRGRTFKAFRSSKWDKNNATVKMLGCNFKTAHKHIERQFTKGMSWDNQGEWHIDHIVPLSSAKTEEQLIKLCHYRNLQPLWAYDNISKGAKMPNVQIQFKL